MITAEMENGSLKNGFRDDRSEALFFCDETSQKKLSGHSFFECGFKNVVFEGSHRGCLFADCVFDHCDFSNCDCHEAVFRRWVRIILCQLRMRKVEAVRMERNIIPRYLFHGMHIR